MNSQDHHSLNCFAAGLLMLFTAGCATPALWHATEKREWRPDSIDQIVILVDSNQQRQLVVLFNQARERDNKKITRKVGWQLGQPPEALATTRAAMRRLTNQPGLLMQPLPILTPTAAANATGRPSSFAVIGYPPNNFVAHINGQPPKDYSLPVTTQTLYTAWTCLLPAAVAADAAIVGTVAVVVVGGAVACSANSGSLQIKK